MTRPRITVHRIGQECEPVAVIEHFAPDPAALRAAAAAARFDRAGVPVATTTPPYRDTHRA